MNTTFRTYFCISDEVAHALSGKQPIVALESTVISHGLPYPVNRALGENMELTVRKTGAIPATIAVLDGLIHIGVSSIDLERLAQASSMHKISSRDIGVAIANKWSGGTTVAATLFAANAVDIRVFATGGIGGVHRLIGQEIHCRTIDISADLPQLSRTPMIVVCAGAKAILDLPATLEYLETWSIPVVGYQTDKFPAFYTLESGLNLTVRANSARDVVDIAYSHWKIGMNSAVLVANPPPEHTSLPADLVEEAIKKSLNQAQEQGISGQAVTPFLLQRVNELTGGDSLQANIELLVNNAYLAGEIAVEFCARQ